MHCLICNNELYITKLRNIKNPRKIGNDFYEYLVCNNCDLWHLNPFPDKNLLSQIYNNEYNLYEDTDTLLNKILNLLSETRIKTILKYKSAPAVVLDIGCGNGTFIKTLKHKGYEVYGTELNLSAAQIAMQKVGKENIFTEELNDNEWYGRCDVISMFHVLEHLDDPKKTMNRLKKYLKKDGIIVLEVPNSDSQILSYAKESYPWLSIPEHVTYWNSKSLSVLKDQLNLKLLSIYNPYSMPFLAYKANPNFKNLIISPIIQYYNSIKNESDIIRHVWASQ